MAIETGKRPAVTDNTAFRIRDLDGAVAHVKQAPTPGHARARKHRVYKIGVELKQQSDRIVSSLERGEAWLAQNEGHAKYREREDQWMQWLVDYEAIEDALERAKEVDR